jgi:hypothetical protein
MRNHCKGVLKQHPLPTAGGVQEVRLISEPDLYRLVVGSRLPAAERFERWVFEDVLPTLRRTGSYFSRPAAADVRGANSAFWLIPPAVRAARSLGLPREAAILAGNRTVAALTGVDVMALMDIEPPQPEQPASRPEANFLLAWQHGQITLPSGQPLPFVPCTGRQLHGAYRLWCGEQGVPRPACEALFIGYVARLPGWQAGRTVATWLTPGSRESRARKMVIPPPGALSPPEGQRFSDWLTEGYFTFQAALDGCHEPTPILRDA